MRELFRSEYFVLTVDDALGLLVRARTDRPFASPEEVDAGYAAVAKAMAPIERARYALLVDVRLAPARNDPVYEQIVERHAPKLFGGFNRTALLAKTEAGRLQINRLRGNLHPDAQIFTDEAAAFSYLLDARDP